MPVNNNSFGLATAGNPLPGLAPPPPPGMEEHLSKFDIEVNESLVGAVLGPAGRSIVEIQQFSGILPSYVDTCNYIYEGYRQSESEVQVYIDFRHMYLLDMPKPNE